jgi:hypothetical protein
MMTRIRTIGLAVVAVFAVMGLAAASASALNNENPVLVKSNGEAVSGVSVTGKAKAVATLGTTLANAAKVECTTETSVGTVSTTLTGNGMTNGTGSIKFTGCKEGGGKCENTGTAGEILNTVSLLLVWEGKENSKTLAVLVSILPFAGRPGVAGNNTVTFTCSGTLIDVQGSFIALVSSKVNELVTKSTLIAKEITGSNGAQEDLTYTENGVSTTNTLWARETTTGTFVAAGESVENEETYSTSVKVIEN